MGFYYEKHNLFTDSQTVPSGRIIVKSLLVRKGKQCY